jgi:crossover junction endodeoxyribonuclease RuvC
MRVVGVDLSLTATGIADDTGTRTIRVKLEPNASELMRVVRLRNLSKLIGRACKDADLVVLEGPGFNAAHSPQHSLGELAGVVKVCLLQWEVPFVLVSPQQLKKFATGRGNATKDAVLAAAVRDGSAAETNDEADAWWLRVMALAHYNGTASNADRRNVLSQIDWPRLREEAHAS